MSKIATLKTFPTHVEVRESVQQLSEMMLKTSARLDETAAQIKSLEQLPELITEQVTEALKALDPVLQIRQDVQRALEFYDQISAAQRSSLEQLGQELASQANASMESRASALDVTIKALDSQVQGLKSSMASMEASSKRLQALPQKLTTAATDAATEMKTSSGELVAAAATLAVLPSVWLTLVQMLGAAVLGALLVAAGQAGLSRILPSTVTQKNADWAAKVWAKASESERKLLTAIASRPAP